MEEGDQGLGVCEEALPTAQGRARGSSGVSRARRCPWKSNMSNSRNKNCKQEELGEGGEA